MKILLIIKNFDLGGAESHVRSLANRLVSTGHEVFLVSKPGRQVKNLLPMVRCQPMTINDFTLPLQLAKLVKLIRKENIEVIHAHQRLGILLATLAGKITKTPVVATVHGKIRNDLRSGLVKRWVSKVIVVSRNSYTGAQKNRWLQNKTVLILNGVELTAQNQVSFPEQPVILYASRVDKKHAALLQLIIEKVWPLVVEKHPNVKLTISGDGGFIKKIASKCYEVNQQLNSVSIFCNGFIRNNNHYSQNVSLVLGAGRSAIEGLVAGLPTLSLHPKHLGGMITTKNYETYKYGNFVAIDNPEPTAENLFRQIDEFIENQSANITDAGKLKEIATNDFKIENTTAKTVTLYEEVIAETQGLRD